LITYLLLFATLVVAQSESSTSPTQQYSLRQLVAFSQERDRDGDVWFRLAEAYLAADSLDQATDAAKKAIRYEDSARSLDLMGRILSTKKAWRRNAPPYFRKAFGKDPSFVDAVYHLAQYHHQLGEEDEERFLREAIETDPSYAIAYLDLGRFLFDRGDNEEARKAFQGYADLKPRSPDGYYGLAVLATERWDYEEALKLGRKMLSVADERAGGYAMVGQALAARGEHDEAADMFALYLWMISDEERALYEDLSSIASKDELQEFATTPLPDKDGYVERFWKRHDPTLVTGGDMRRLEHYRRVWYARTYFANDTSWDKRGDLFIRYGEPDYRSRSDRVNSLPPAAVERVKEQLANELFRRGVKPGAGLRVPKVGHIDQLGGDITPGFGGWSWEVEDTTVSRVYLHAPPDIRLGDWSKPVFPVDRAIDGTPIVAWESWVYTNLGGGVEFVFTDQYLSGSFDFAPIPMIGSAPLLRIIARTSSGPLYQQMSTEQPELFGPPPGVRPLDFYYDMASFKGNRGLTSVELYFGVPAMNLLDSLRTIRTGVSFHRKIVLSGQATGDLIQKNDEITLDRPLHLSTAAGGMYVSMLTVNAIPDSYRVAVQLTDRETGKWGLYMQDLVVPTYSDSLELSDLQVSSQASDSTRIEAFKKGDFWIVPAPSRMFPDSSSVFIYYEIYNMDRDGMGMSDYTVSYTVREEERKQRLFGSLVRSIPGFGKPEATETKVTLRRYSWEQNEKVFFEIEPDQLEPGLKRIGVTIKDNVTGQEVSRETALWVVGNTETKE
jgi:GWxTD domain-containing protein